MNIKRMPPDLRIQTVESTIEGAAHGGNVEFPVLEVTWRQTRYSDVPQITERLRVFGLVTSSTNGTSSGELIVQTPEPTRVPYRFRAISLALIDSIRVPS